MNLFCGERSLTSEQRTGFWYEEAAHMLRETIGRAAAAHEIRVVGDVFVARPIVGDGPYYVYCTSKTANVVGRWVERGGIRDGRGVADPRPEDLPGPEPEPEPFDRPVYIGDRVKAKLSGQIRRVTELSTTSGTLTLQSEEGPFRMARLKEPAWREFWVHLDDKPIADVRSNTSATRPEPTPEPEPLPEPKSAWARLLDD